MFCEFHTVSTFETDNKVRKYAKQLRDTKILTKLAVGDIVAIADFFYTKCLVAYQIRATQEDSSERSRNQSVILLNPITFAEIVSSMEGFRAYQQTVLVFVLVDCSQSPILP